MVPNTKNLNANIIMSFGRHRQPIEEIKIQESIKEKILEVKKDPVIEIVKEVIPDAHIVVIEPEEKAVVIEGYITVHKDVLEEQKKEARDNAIASRKKAKTEARKNITTEIAIEEVKPVIKAPKKKREDKKEVNKLGLIGSTIVANDFRAIVTKRGEQINVVLTKILHDWNMANYNL